MSPWRRIYPIYPTVFGKGPGPSSKVKAIVLFVDGRYVGVKGAILVFLQVWG